jgi:hypothetical protein
MPSDTETTDTEAPDPIEHLTTPLPPISELAEYIHDYRITHTTLEHGVSIRGSPFICHFDSEVDPKRVATDITTTDDPWQMFGIVTAHKPTYYSVRGNLIHVDDGEATGSSKLTVEIAPTWIRVYVKDDADAERVAVFIHALSRVFSLESINFHHQTEKDTQVDTDEERVT